MEETREMVTIVTFNSVPAVNMKATGVNITRLREAAGLSVRNIQEIFGFATPQAIYKWQNGVSLPTIDNLVVLAAVLGVTMDEIIITDNNIHMSATA